MDHLEERERSALMARVRGRDTKPELIVRRLTHRLGFRFRLHRRELPGSPDLVFVSRRKVAFVHGCFWHQHKCKRGTRPASNTEFWNSKLDRNRQRDREAVKLLKKDGWKILVIWECEVKNEVRLSKRISKFLCE